MSTRLLDEMRNVMRRRHYSIHTERAYRDWVKRYVRFHNMQSKDDLRHGEGKIEAFLTGVGPGLIIAGECLHGEGAPHCQDTTPVFDMIARAETTRDRIGGFGRASAASEWLVRHAAPIACRSV